MFSMGQSPNIFYLGVFGIVICECLTCGDIVMMYAGVVRSVISWFVMGFFQFVIGGVHETY